MNKKEKHSERRLRHSLFTREKVMKKILLLMAVVLVLTGCDTAKVCNSETTDSMFYENEIQMSSESLEETPVSEEEIPQSTEVQGVFDYSEDELDYLYNSNEEKAGDANIPQYLIYETGYGRIDGVLNYYNGTKSDAEFYVQVWAYNQSVYNTYNYDDIVVHAPDIIPGGMIYTVTLDKEETAVVAVCIDTEKEYVTFRDNGITEIVPYTGELTPTKVPTEDSSYTSEELAHLKEFRISSSHSYAVVCDSMWYSTRFIYDWLKNDNEWPQCMKGATLALLEERYGYDIATLAEDDLNIIDTMIDGVITTYVLYTDRIPHNDFLLRVDHDKKMMTLRRRDI